MILLELFWTFFKIGAFTFGGGYAMLPLIQSEVVGKGWMDISTMVDFVAVCESTPGPLAVNMATFIGSALGGVPGAVCATLGVVLPSFIIILIIAAAFKAFSKNRYVVAVMSGLKPAVVGLIGSAVVSVGMTAFFPAGFSLAGLFTFETLAAAVIFVAAMGLNHFKVHPILIIVITAGLGIVFSLLLKVL